MLPALCRHRSRCPAFTLIEMIGVLAAVAILAAVLAPALIRQADKLAADQEIGALQSFGAAIQNHVLRTRVIPDNTAWIGVVTNELGMSFSLVSTTPRGRARVFVIDDTGFGAMTLSYTQTTAGVSAPPPQPRFMIVSSLGAALPAGLVSRPGPVIFNDLWNTAPAAMPANPIWAGWNGGRSEDLLVQRINLAPFFVHLILATNNSTANYASYQIDSGAIRTNTLIGGAVDAFFVQGSVLTLYSNAVPDSQQVLLRDSSFVYDQNLWRSSITSISVASTNPPDFSGIVNAFIGSGPAAVTPTRSQVVVDFIAYMTNYINWANFNFPAGAQKNAVINSYNTMTNDVYNLVTAVKPQ
jgi:type II secretory pathway pseudopilin PulG